jgi:hypothetical protein
MQSDPNQLGVCVVIGSSVGRVFFLLGRARPPPTMGSDKCPAIGRVRTFRLAGHCRISPAGRLTRAPPQWIRSDCILRCVPKKPSVDSQPWIGPPYFMRIDTLNETRRQGNPHPDEDWIAKTKSRLFWEPLQCKATGEKLAAIKVAIASGADPNEMDHSPNPRRHRGRPLHCAIDAGREQGETSWEAIKGNLPVIKFLLEVGADPRVPGFPSKIPRLRSVIEEAEVCLYEAETERPWWNINEDPEEIANFYREILKLLREAGTKLDGEFCT